MKDIGKHVLEKIKEEGVKPYPKWHFVIRQAFVWTFFGLAIFLGGMATGVAIFQLRHIEWDIYQHITHSLFEFLLLAAPYFWIAFIVLFAGFACYYFRKTEKGYKFSTLFVAGISFFLSMILGGILAVTVLPGKLDTAFEDNLEFYRWVEAHRHQMWMAPERGFLAGTIKSVSSEDRLEIEDLNGHLWQVVISEAVFKGNIEPVKNQRIKLIGHMDGRGQFTAKEIRPFSGICPEDERCCRSGRKPGQGRRFHGQANPDCPFGPPDNKN
ncbi:MAG: hypothetical protein KJ737_00155 [Proteobacteria bacterium]|nr:hypothetical protein [Pseudomonadota bacterium]